MTSFLLPILAIMLVTSEWSQRTALVTFTLEPRRSRVVLAKLVVAQLFTVLTLVVAFVVGVGLHGDLRARPTRPHQLGRSALGDLAGWLVTADADHARRVRPGDPVAQHPGVDRGVRGLPLRAARRRSPRRPR